MEDLTTRVGRAILVQPTYEYTPSSPICHAFYPKRAPLSGLVLVDQASPSFLFYRLIRRCREHCRADKSLRQYIEDVGGRLSLNEAMPILIDVIEALVGLQNQVVHRDLNPGNVLAFQGHWCLADFGIARYADAKTASSTRKQFMSDPYAAPEQWRHERATPATDVYAFGVMAFELLQGHKPFPGPKAHDFRDQHLHQQPPPLTGCPPSIASLVAECLYKAPQARPTAANILARLRTSQKASSPATAKLQAANQTIVDKQVVHDVQASAKRSLEQKRAELVIVARQSFSQLRDALVEQILEAAPKATISPPPRSNVFVSLGDGRLFIDAILPAPADSLGGRYGSPPFDVIAYTLISARKPLDHYGYEGRSHSLWFCDAHDAGVYRWFETAFMIQPLVRESSTINPFALAPTDEDAGGAFSNTMTVRQIAWEPLPFDQGDGEQFIERWLGWFAAAVAGTLTHPRVLPEGSGGRHRQGR